MSTDTLEGFKENIDKLTLSHKERSISLLHSIISKLPKVYSNLIDQTFIHKRVPKEYLLSSILFAISTSIGLTFYIEALGYKNHANLYFSIIGSRGDAKSEAMKIATDPLKHFDDENYEKNINELNNCDFDDENKPKRKQVLIQNATIEAVHKVHSNNPNSIGVSIDEIYTLIEKMGNSSTRDGIEWRTFFLQGYTNCHIDISRKTTDSFRIKNSYPTLLGGIQHQFVPKLFSNGNLESGFIDRQFFTPKLTKNKKLSKEKIDPKVMKDYNNSVCNILDYKCENPDKALKSFEIKLATDAEDELFCYVQKLIDRQSSSEKIIEEYMAKMQISIHKLGLLVHMMINASTSNFRSVITLDTIKLAIELNEFYYFNFRIILEDNNEGSNIPSVKDIIKYAQQKGLQQKDVMNFTRHNKGYISRTWNKQIPNRQQATSLRNIL